MRLLDELMSSLARCNNWGALNKPLWFKHLDGCTGDKPIACDISGRNCQSFFSENVKKDNHITPKLYVR